MWEYNYTPSPEEIYHSKYLRKYMGKNGKMVYVYKGHAENKQSGYSENYRDYNDRNGKTFLTTSKGHNNENNFKTVSIGRGANSRNDYKYKQKSFNLGKKKITIDNDEGRLNVAVYEKRNKKKINKGRKKASKYLK